MQMAESEYIELIDKYLVTRNESGCPSYKWDDNTGEIVRCRDCKLWDETDSYGWIRLGNYYCKCKNFSMEQPDEKFVKHYTAPNDYCSHGVKRGDAE